MSDDEADPDYNYKPASDSDSDEVMQVDYCGMSSSNVLQLPEAEAEARRRGVLDPQTLSSVWACPYINKFVDDDDKRVWTCDWCKAEKNGGRPKPFKTWNVTKALAHLCGDKGQRSIRVCDGEIPDEWQALFQELSAQSKKSKEGRMEAKDLLSSGISIRHDDIVSNLSKTSSKSTFPTIPRVPPMSVSR